MNRKYIKRRQVSTRNAPKKEMLERKEASMVLTCVWCHGADPAPRTRALSSSDTTTPGSLAPSGGNEQNYMHNMKYIIF